MVKKVAFGVGLMATAVAASSTGTCAVVDSDKVDCGYMGINEAGCIQNGCCWQPAGEGSTTPWCFNTKAATGYTVSGLTETETGVVATLNLNSGANYVYGADLQQLSLEVVYENADTVRVKIADSNSARFEIPASLIPRPHATTSVSKKNVKVTITEAPFSFKVTRVSDDSTIFELGEGFTFKDQYLEIPIAVNPTATTYGVGESARLQQAHATGTIRTLWGGDVPSMQLDVNTYGSYPYYTQVVDGKAHGVMLFNSAGMDVVFGPGAITYRSTGGIFDLYVFNGPTPRDVSKQYTNIVGRATMMPYWSLGFHNCRYGYTGVDEVKSIVQKYREANIPMDTQWIDIDYMDLYRDFTYNGTTWNQAAMAELVDDLHAHGQSFVPIIDPGIMVSSGYEAYERLMNEELYVRGIDGKPYLGQVWPGPTYFPDFFHPGTQSYWTDMIADFYQMTPIDGLWIDMNEIANFCNTDGKGQVCEQTSACPAYYMQTSCCLSCHTVDENNKLDFPAYNIHNVNGLQSTKTVANSAYMYGNITMFDAHNLYGLTEQVATKTALENIRNKRAFVLSRSSFMSSGKHTAKWTGDNAATWNDLKASIVGVKDFNLFGVPMIGADLCGFIYDTNEELCARWIALGAFFPFSRNHNTYGAAPQELYLWDSVADAARESLSYRYMMLPYYYTNMYKAHSEGDLMVRGLWANFPEDSNTLYQDYQFMIGDGVLLTPVVDQGTTWVTGYFPQGLWFNFATYHLDFDHSAGGDFKSIDTPLSKTNVHVFGGNILPLQQAAITTTAGRNTPFSFLTALNEQGQASGSLFWDDGEQINLDKILTADYSAQANGSSGSFTARVGTATYSVDLPVEKVVVLAKGNSAPSSASVQVGATKRNVEFSFDYSTGALTFTNLNVNVNDNFTLSWM